MSDKSALKAKQDELSALTDKFVSEFLASALVRSLLAPLESEIELLKEKLAPSAKKDEAKPDAS